MALGVSLALLMTASMAATAISGTAAVFAEQIGAAAFVLFATALVNMYLWLYAPGVGRILSLVIAMQLIVWGAALTYLLGVLVGTVLDSWDYFRDAAVPTQPPPTQDCTRAAALSPGMNISAVDLAAGAIIACASSSRGSGGDSEPPSIPTGLRNASEGLLELFTPGSIRNKTIIEVREVLTRNGFTQQKAEGTGYLFTNALGEQVRIMYRNGSWDIRVRNQFGNYLDEFGNVAPPGETHGIPTQNQ
jgi:hypothetical protein